MNLQTKLGYAKRQIEQIAQHDDEPFAVREAALQHLVALITFEAIEAKKRAAAVEAAKIAAITPNKE